MPWNRLFRDNGPDSGIAGKIIRKYQYCQDQILSDGKVRNHGTAIRCSDDFWNYITHAAFHKLEGLTPPAALGRSGGAPWFSSRRAAITISRRFPSHLTPGYYDYFLSQIPESVYTDPRFETYSGVFGSKRTGIMHVSFFCANIRSLATIANDHPSGLQGLIRDWKQRVAPVEINFWMRGFAREYPSALVMMEEFGRHPDRRIFNRDMVLSGVKLDNEVVGFVCFEKYSTADTYKFLIVALKEVGDPGQSRLIKVAAKRHHESLYSRRELSLDFIGGLTRGAAIMGHRVFKAVRHKEMNRLRLLAPEEYAPLFRKVSSYRYPTFSREHTATPMDVVRYGLRKYGWL